MSAFDYEAMDQAGKPMVGQVKAETQRDAVRLLAARGLTPITVGATKPARQAPWRFALERPPSAQDYILTVKQFSLLLNSGVPLVAAVETLKSQGLHPDLSAAFSAMSKSLRAGTSFSNAFASSLPTLPPYAFQLSAAGESIGELGPALADTAKQMEYDYRVKQDIKNALTYPAILVSAGLGAVLFIFLVVVPRFSAMLASSKEPLPFLSEVVLSTGMFLSENSTFVFILLAALVASSVWLFNQPAVRDSVQQSMTSVPLLGSWLKEAELAKWSSMLSTMLRHGVDLIKALEFARGTVGIKSIHTRMEQVSKLVRSGKSLSIAMREQETFSDTALSLVQVGEESGELSGMLGSLATLYEESGRQRMKRFLLILEPAAIILIGVVIGGIVTAIMLAITSVNQVTL
ncbi:MAG: type II secretion system F family protein [Alphaproteobacteria bacterium]|nr:type II secretion system F family protein [Alphaproteobacteria bacterium]